MDHHYQNKLENNGSYTSSILKPNSYCGGIVFESVKKYDSYKFDFTQTGLSLFPESINHFDNKFSENLISAKAKYNTQSIGMDLNHNEVKHYQSISSWHHESQELQMPKNTSDHILENQDHFISHNAQFCQRQQGPIYCHESSLDKKKTNVLCTKENQNINFHSSLNQNTTDPYNYEYDTTTATVSFDSNKSHFQKRKQVHNIEHNSPPEFLDDSSFLKNRSETKLQALNYENLYSEKLVSVLKNNRNITKRNRNTLKKLNKKSMTLSEDATVLESVPFTASSDFQITKELINVEEEKQSDYEDNQITFSENIADSSNTTLNSEFSSLESSTNEDSQTDLLTMENLDTRLNSEFTDADYFNYVNPREIIIESDIDKLLTPSMADEFLEVHHSFENKICEKEIALSSQNMYNNNKISLDAQKTAVQEPNLSSIDVAEKYFCEKLAQAKKFDFPNYFNTCNKFAVEHMLHKFNVVEKFFCPNQTKKEIFNSWDSTSSLSFSQNINSSAAAAGSEKLKQFNVGNKPTGELVIKIKRIDDISNEYMVENKAAEKSKGHVCQECLEIFKTKKLLNNHVSERHKDQSDAENKMCVIKSKKKLSKHKNFKCTYCDKSYCYNASLKRHISTHQDKLNLIQKM